MSETSAVGMVASDLVKLLNEEEADIAFHEFFGDMAGHNNQDQWEVMLYEEWLLFDWRDEAGKPLLERGLEAGSFMQTQRERCRQLLTNIYSDWQVVDRVTGYGLTLEDVYTDKPYKIRHARYSTELPVGSLFRARLALVDDRWMPASGFIEPWVLEFPQGNRSDFFGKRPEELNPRMLLLERRLGASERLGSKKNREIPQLPLPESHKLMQKALTESELDSYVSLETVESWMRADLNRTPQQIKVAPYPLALSMLLGLAMGRNKSTIAQLTLAVAALQRSITKTSTSAKTKRQQKSSKTQLDKDTRTVVTFDPDAWVNLFDQAAACMRSADTQQATELFEQAFGLMHTERTTNPLVFRQLHNAALAYLYNGEETLGRRVLAASLALNPSYDLGLKTKKSLDDGAFNTLLSLGNMQRTLRTMMSARPKKGQRLRLQRPPKRSSSPITKYADWLQTLGVNFLDDSPTDEIRAIGSELTD